MLGVDLIFIRVNQRLLLALLRLISSRRRSWCETRRRPHNESLGSIMAGHGRGELTDGRIG